MTYDKVDRRIMAAFVDPPRDNVIRRMIDDLKNLDKTLEGLNSNVENLRNTLQSCLKERDEKVIQIVAMESAIVAYDHALYEIRNDPKFLERNRR
jgi:hypothetical protein